jgi:hypothetical protein
MTQLVPTPFKAIFALSENESNTFTQPYKLINLTQIPESVLEKAMFVH